MTSRQRHPKILVVTSEVTSVPQGMGPGSRSISTSAGSLGDIAAGHLRTLYERGIDVHLAMPNYRSVFQRRARHLSAVEGQKHGGGISETGIHLAQDRSFFYHPQLLETPDWEHIRIALAFQREVMNRIIPEVRPDLIHCFDWMTGLIPAMARRHGIPCLFTMSRLDSPRLSLATIEEWGIDAASFWQHCFYERMPVNYQETRDTNPVDLLTSGVFAATVVSTPSRHFLNAITDDRTHHATEGLKTELRNKEQAGRIFSVAPAPPMSFNPATDRALMRNYGPTTHYAGKRHNKRQLQETLKLSIDASAPLCFWPTRLDGSRPGCRFMAETLPVILNRHRDQRLQIVFIADGDFQDHVRTVINRLHAGDRAVVCDFDARRQRLAYGGADFVLMPLHLDAWAFPGMIGQRYGALPIAHDAGAIRDCASPLEDTGKRGSGFLFKHFDVNGFLWAMDQAMAFYRQPQGLRVSQVQRIMSDAMARFDPSVSARRIMTLYARALNGFSSSNAAASEHALLSRIAA